MTDATLPQRIVPGAAPPAPLSKSQKKKRKSVLKPKLADNPPAESILPIADASTVAFVEKAPAEEDVKQGAVAEELVAQPEQIQEVVQDKFKKSGPAVELLNKRIKVLTKKLSRIAVYSSKPPSELNDDQLKSVASLPAIQGAIRELEEARKAMETLEAEQIERLSKQRAEEEGVTNQRIAQALSESNQSHQQRISQILTLLRLSSLLSAADPTTFTLVIDDTERQGLHAAAVALLGPDNPRKDEITSGLMLADGDIDGVSYARLLELVGSYRNPSAESETTPAPQTLILEPASETLLVEQEASDGVAEEPSMPGAGENTLPVAPSGSFHFMQESELESAPFENGAEWVEKPEESEMSVEHTPEPLSAINTGLPTGVNGVSHHMDEPPLSAVSGALDWAADDADGLPSINSLHAKFGTPGDVTPEATTEGAALPTSSIQAEPEPEWSATQTDAWGDAPAGVASTVVAAESWGTTATNNGQIDEEGFVKAKGSRGRQSEQRADFRGERGRGGFRGDRAGEFRGGYRGRGSGGDSFGSGWRGGDSEFRGRGGFRGDRARGGDFRGRGGRGEFRGRGRGDRGYRGRGGFDKNGEQGERQAQTQTHQ